MKKDNRVRTQKQRKVFLSLLLCFAMLAQPISVFAAEISTGVKETQELNEKVNSLLSAGKYKDGEAVVIVRTEDIPEDGFFENSETLLEAEAEDCEYAGAELLGSLDAVGETGGLTVLSVSEPEMSTGTLLRKLLKDSRVLSAEPNYIYDGPEPEEGSSLLGSTPAEEELLKATPSSVVWNEAERSAAAIGSDYMSYDLTGSQWSLNRQAGDKRFTLIDQEAENGISDLNLEGWNGGETNADCTVVVFDQGVDYTHPDLANVMADLSPYVQQLEDQYGIVSGQYGINVQDPGNAADPMPVGYYTSDGGFSGTHGTHVAGIIASEWGNGGTSGVANGVKLISVNFLGNGEYAGSLIAELKGYTYIYRLAQIAGENLNIRVVNESFGGGVISAASSLAMAQLAKEGIVVVRAAGNEHRTLDYQNDNSATVFPVKNALIVGAANAGGNPDISYTNNGTYVDVYSPGSDILSPIPLNMAYSGGQYFPEAYKNTNPDKQPYYQTFENVSTVFNDAGKLSTAWDNTVCLWNENWDTRQSSGSYTGATGFDTDGGALKIDLASLLPKKVDDQNVMGAGFYLGLKLGSEALGGTLVDPNDSKIVRIDPEDSSYTVYANLKEKLKFFGMKWGTAQTDDSGLIINPLIFKEGGSYVYSDDFTIPNSEDSPLKADGNTTSDNNACINFEKYLLEAEHKKIDYRYPISCQIIGSTVEYWMYLRINPYSTYSILVPGETMRYLYLDCIGSGVQLLPYINMDGTSMATPTASGLAAVEFAGCAKEEAFAELTKEEQALYVIERIKSNVVSRPSMEDKCQTGGLISAIQKTDKQPVITKVSVVSAKDGTLRIDGTNFGSYDAALCSVSVKPFGRSEEASQFVTLSVEQWNGEEKTGSVLCKKAEGMKTGVYTIRVKTGQKSCIYPAVLRFEDASVFETELTPPSSAFDMTQVSKDDLVHTMSAMRMAGAGGKMFLIPESEYYRELWVYDPANGTGEEAFSRLEKDSLPEMFGREENSLMDVFMAAAGGKLWLYGKAMKTVGENSSPQSEASILGEGSEPVEWASLIAMDPVTYEREIFYNPETMKDDSTQMVSMGEKENWLAFPYIAWKKGEPGAEDYSAGNRLEVFFYDTKSQWFTGTVGVTLPDGIVRDENTSVQFAGAPGALYAAIGYDTENGRKQGLYKFAVSFSGNEQDGYQASVKLKVSMEMPEFDTAYDGRYALTVIDGKPVLTAATMTTGEDAGHDTFLFDPVTGEYEAYKKNFSVEPVFAASAAVSGGSLYAVGINTLAQGTVQIIMRSTKLKEDPAKEYTITFKNGETVLQTVTAKSGEMPVYTGETPVKPETEAAAYTFRGWDPKVVPAAADTAYQAMFTEIAKKYLVTFDNQGHGQVPESQLVAAGSLITDPKMSDVSGYLFQGWYSDTALQKKWDFAADKMPAGNLRLYAGWSVSGGGTGTSGGSTAAGSKTVVLQPNGTQTFGGSIVSLPLSMIGEADRKYLVQTPEWMKTSAGWQLKEGPSGTVRKNGWALVPDSAGSSPVGNYSWYYFDANGIMLTGWQWIPSADGKLRCYYLNEAPGSLQGACLLGGSVNGYNLSSSGSWTGPDGKEVIK